MAYGEGIPEGYERADNDWYVEPAWCVDALLEVMDFGNRVLDPACGMGTIPKRLIELGVEAEGRDLIDRGYGYKEQDFFSLGFVGQNIVTNPPYNCAEDFIRHALNVMANGRYACFLVQSKFLYSQKRFELFNSHYPELVMHLSRRPSMPPGKELERQGEEMRGGGKYDFCWVVWKIGNEDAMSGCETYWSMGYDG